MSHGIKSNNLFQSYCTSNQSSLTAKSSCYVKIGNLQGLKAGGDDLLDNFLNIIERMNLKCGMYATQDCRSGHRCDTSEFL